MTIRAHASIEDLCHLDRKAELVNGQVVLMSPTGGGQGYAADEIFASLREYAKRAKNGRAVGDNKAFLVSLPHRQSFSQVPGQFRSH
jgi:Uma2 family endonuclease